jgi:hypothetical protein
MGIRGDMQAIIESRKNPDEAVDELLVWLTSADVLTYLCKESTEDCVSGYLDCISALEEKCATRPATRNGRNATVLSFP